jgi:hypothetical protein
VRRRLRCDAGQHRKPEYRRASCTTKRRWKCVCGNYGCRTRVTLAKHPATYQRGKRCRVCRGPLRVDYNRTLRREHRKVLCHCLEAHYPHRRGWCLKRQRLRAELQA